MDIYKLRYMWAQTQYKVVKPPVFSSNIQIVEGQQLAYPLSTVFKNIFFYYYFLRDKKPLP